MPGRNQSVPDPHFRHGSRTMASTSGNTPLHVHVHVHVGGLNGDSVQRCYDALSMMDPSKKKGWEQARVRCSPEVLEHECCPCYFLAVSHSNPWDAAQRICRYWDERVRLFEGRAFDALTSGSGSDVIAPTGLSQSDVAILEAGYQQVLPSDSKGRRVYFYNSGPMPSTTMHHDINGRLRVRWYILHKCFTCGEAQAHRVVTITLLHPSHHRATDFAYAAACMKLPTFLPYQHDLIHLLVLPSMTGTGRMAQGVLAIAMNVIGNLFQNLVPVHFGDQFPTVRSAKRAVAATPTKWIFKEGSTRMRRR